MRYAYPGSHSFARKKINFNFKWKDEVLPRYLLKNLPIDWLDSTPVHKVIHNSQL